MKQQKNRSSAETGRVSNLIVLASVILLMPLVHIPGLADPVQAPRLLFMGAVLGLSIIPLLLKSKPAGIRLEFPGVGIILAFLAYILFLLLSMVFAVNPKEGLFDLGKSVLSFLTLFLFSYLLIRDPQNLTRILRLFILASFVLSAIGLGQYLIHVSGRMGEGMYARLYMVRGLSGHKVAYSILLYLTLPAEVYGIYTFSRPWRLFSLFSLMLVFSMIVITQTRAVWIGCAMATLIAAIYFSVFRYRKGRHISGRRMKLVFSPFLLLLLAGLVYFSLSPGFRKVVAYQLSGMADTDNVSNLPRISILGSTFEMTADHPLSGVGAGNWKISVPPYQYDYVYYMIDHRHPEVRFQNWIRPHNDLAWVLSEKGPGGMLAFLGVFVFIFLAGNRIIFRSDDDNKVLLAVLITGVLGGYFLLSMFSFPLERMDNQVYLMVLMALLIALMHNLAPQSQTKPGTMNKGFLGAALLLAVSSAVYGVFMIKAEYDLARLVNGKPASVEKSAVVAALRNDANLVSLDPFANPLKYYLGVDLVRSGENARALKMFQQAYRDHPNNVNLLLDLMKVSLRTGDLELCQRYGSELLEIFPFHEEGLMILAMTYFMEGEHERSLQTLLTVKQKSDVLEKAIRKTLSRIDMQRGE